MPAFSRLIRFLTPTNQIHYGDAILPPNTTDARLAKYAYILTGNPLTPNHTLSATPTPISRLLSPLPASSIPTIRCLGLNYRAHALESQMPIPTTPVLFYQPSTASTGPLDPIPIPLLAQESEGLDYECELIAIIGTEGRDIPECDALSHILGYAVGNDVSHRDLQLHRGGGGQWSLGKGFDGWAPWGPAIVTPALVPAPQDLAIWTNVNGAERQRSWTGDMVFGVARTVSLLSRGTTLRVGDLLWTGTPAGVGMGMSPKKGWLEDGDEVVVGLEGVGTCVNRVVFEKGKARL